MGSMYVPQSLISNKEMVRSVCSDLHGSPGLRACKIAADKAECLSRPSSSGQKAELDELRQLFYASAFLTLPVFLLGMVFPMMPVMQPFLMIQILGFPLDEIIKWALVTPVQFSIGWRFHKGAWLALWNRRWAPSLQYLAPHARRWLGCIALRHCTDAVRCLQYGLQDWLHASRRLPPTQICAHALAAASFGRHKMLWYTTAMLGRA